MRFSTLALVHAVLLTVVHGWDTTTSASVSITSPPTSPVPCPTVTQIGGSGCPAPPSGCTIDECITVSTITQPCDCLTGLPTTTFCETTCHQGCQTSTAVLRIPCATSVSSSSSLSSSISSSVSSCTDASCLSSSSSTSSSSSSCTDASCTSSTISSTTSTPYYSNSTVTVTSITTLTTCPYDNKCHGQTTIWTGTQGPFPCSAKPTCTCVLPGGGGTTITGPTTTTQITTVGPTSTNSSSASSSASSTGPGGLQSSGGERRITEGWVGMVIAGILGLL